MFVYEEDKKNIFWMSVCIKNSYTLNSSQSSPETDHVLSMVTFSISLTKEVIELLDFELKPLTRRSILGSDCIDSFFDALSALWVLTECSLSAHWVLTECSLVAHLTADLFLTDCLKIWARMMKIDCDRRTDSRQSREPILFYSFSLNLLADLMSSLRPVCVSKKWGPRPCVHCPAPCQAGSAQDLSAPSIKQSQN